MRRIKAERLTAEAFKGFGQVLTPPDSGRTYFDETLANRRERAHPSLSLVTVQPATGQPLRVEKLERHEFSSQSFVPMGDCRYLVLVASRGGDGRPDLAGVRAFVADGGQGVTYGVDVWHHGLTVFDRAASFAIFMWNDGGPADTELVDVEPFEIEVG